MQIDYTQQQISDRSLLIVAARVFLRFVHRRLYPVENKQDRLKQNI